MIMNCEHKKRILVVDDEDVILFSYKKIFQGCSMEVEVCATPETAIQMIRNNVYDAVISDIRFSDSDSKEGLDILQYVRENSPATPVILMTGYNSAEIKEKAIALGAAYYFEKPVAISTIEDSLKTLGVIDLET